MVIILAPPASHDEYELCSSIPYQCASCMKLMQAYIINSCWSDSDLFHMVANTHGRVPAQIKFMLQKHSSEAITVSPIPI